jgi:hypothetical protein
MNSRIVLGIGLAAAIVFSALLIVPRAGAAQAAQTLPAITRSVSSEDGRELFNLHMYEPWEGAGRRVVTVTAASISKDGLVGLDFRRFCDTGAPAEPLTIKGYRFECVLTFGVQSWASIDGADDITMTVTAAD